MSGLTWRPKELVKGERPFNVIEAEPPRTDSRGHVVPGSVSFYVEEELDVASFVAALNTSKPVRSRIFARGQLTQGGNVLLRTDQLEADSVVDLALIPPKDGLAISPTEVEVLYQDPFLLVAVKPAGVLVHSDGTGSAAAHDTLTARVAARLRAQGSAAVPQALHRLDTDTSGIVLFSLTSEFQPVFDALVAGAELRKRYYAVVQGRFAAPEDSWRLVDAPIARDRHDARRMRVGTSGKEAQTRVRSLVSHGNRTLVEAELVTGRRHQIRVHLARLGHPIVGDVLYGGTHSAKGLMLHAHEVSFAHPLTGEGLRFSCDPAWMQSW